MRRGEVWWADLGSGWGRRPVLLLSREGAYDILTQVSVAPLTSSIRLIPSTVLLDPRADSVPRQSVVNLDGILTISTQQIHEFIVHLRPEKMHEVEQAIHFALGLSF